MLDGVEHVSYYTARSERSDKSNFPIKCIHNLNDFNQETVKYSQMHAIYLFLYICTYIYSNCLKWPPSESIQRAARFLLCRTIFLKVSSSMSSANLLTRRRKSHIFLASPSSHVTYIDSEKNSPAVKGLANMVANDVLCCERWLDQILIAKITNIVQ